MVTNMNVPPGVPKSPRELPGETDRTLGTLRTMEAEGPPHGHTACPWHNQSQSQDCRSRPSLLCPAPPLSDAWGWSRCFGHFDFSYFGGCADSQSPLSEGNLISCEKVQTWGSDTQPFKCPLHHRWLRDPTPGAGLPFPARGRWGRWGSTWHLKAKGPRSSSLSACCSPGILLGLTGRPLQPRSPPRCSLGAHCSPGFPLGAHWAPAATPASSQVLTGHPLQPWLPPRCWEGRREGADSPGRGPLDAIEHPLPFQLRESKLSPVKRVRG